MMIKERFEQIMQALSYLGYEKHNRWVNGRISSTALQVNNIEFDKPAILDVWVDYFRKTISLDIRIGFFLNTERQSSYSLRMRINDDNFDELMEILESKPTITQLFDNIKERMMNNDE